MFLVCLDLIFLPFEHSSHKIYFRKKRVTIIGQKEHKIQERDPEKIQKKVCKDMENFLGI